VVRPEPSTRVLAHQHHGDVDVVVGVAHGHPPRPTRIPGHRDPGAAEQYPRDPRPLHVGQDTVGGGDPR
jgi:hypothetical protein